MYATLTACAFCMFNTQNERARSSRRRVPLQSGAVRRRANQPASGVCRHSPVQRHGLGLGRPRRIDWGRPDGGDRDCRVDGGLEILLHGIQTPPRVVLLSVVIFVDAELWAWCRQKVDEEGDDGDIITFVMVSGCDGNDDSVATGR